MKTADFVRHTASTLATRVLVMALTLLIGVITARTLGPAGVGAFSLAVVLPSLVSLLLQFGLGPANVYLIGRKKYPVDVLLGNAVTLSLITSAVVLPIYWALMPLLLRTVAVGVEPSVLRLIGIAFPLALVGGHLSFIFLALERVAEYNRLNLVRNGSMLILILVLVVGLRLGVAGAVAAMAVAWGLVIVRALTSLRGVVRLRLGIDWPVLRAALSLGARAYLANLIQFFNYRLDVLIVSYFLGMSQVGWYSTAFAVAEVLWYMPEAAATVLFPRTAGASDADARDFTPRVARQVFMLTFCASLVVAIVSRPLVLLLFSPEYERSIEPLRLLLPGVVVLALGKVLASDLAGRGLLLYNTLGSLAALVVTVAGDLVLIPSLGIRGAAVASSLSYAVTTAVLLFWYTRVSGNSLRDLIVPRSPDFRVYHKYLAQVGRLWH